MRATDKHADQDHDLDADESHDEDRSEDDDAAPLPAVAQVVHRVAAAMRRVLADSPRLPDEDGLSRAHHRAMIDLYAAKRGVDEGDRDLSGGAQKQRLNRALEVLAPVLADALSPEVDDGKKVHAELSAKIAGLRAHIADRIAVEAVIFSAPKPTATADDDSENDEVDDSDKQAEASEAKAERS